VDVSVLAAELINKSLWYPTILGVLVVVAGVGLFCGSVYLLLGTNLGARLGFLVAFTALMGFMVLLTTLWMTTASPLNTLKGHIPKWVPKEVISNPSKSSIEAVRNVKTDGRKVDAIESSNVKAFLDEALVTVQNPANEGPAPPQPFARFNLVTDYIDQRTYEIGGSSPSFLNFQFRHQPLYAVVQFCAVETIDPTQFPFGVAPPAPKCDTSNPKNGYMVLQRDLGTVRQPPMIAFLSSVILFGLGLLGLHWYEKDRRAAKKAAAEAASRPAEVPPPAPEPEPEPVNA
jgi:hypothetical protein